LWATAGRAIIQRGSLMLSLSLAWHLVWFTRVTLSLVLFLVIITRQLHRQFPLFALYSGWISVAGMAVLAVNYARFTNGYDYFVAIAVSNGVEAVLGFAIIYQMFAERVRRYPAISGMGKSVFRAVTLFFVIIAVVFAWLSPGLGSSHLISLYSVTQRTVRTLQCGQLVFLFLFCGYFRLSWRSRAFGIALGLGILSSTSLAVNAIHSQIATANVWNQSEYLAGLVNDSTYLIAVLVWLSYMIAPEPALQPTDGPLPPHDLETWNRELKRLLEP
jgi:hypothetical protein